MSNVKNFKQFLNEKFDDCSIDYAGISEKYDTKCPKCNHQFNYNSIPESGMGYIKCPKCKEVITQKDIKTKS